MQIVKFTCVTKIEEQTNQIFTVRDIFFNALMLRHLYTLIGLLNSQERSCQRS